MSFLWRGAVLAGGASRRMGRDKATLLLAGEPLWQRQVRVLREAGAAEVALVRAPDQPALDADLPHLRDSVRGVGPLAGLHAALAADGAPLVAILAVDMPRIDAAWFRWLLGFCSAETGAVALHAGGSEPLAAFYPRAALPLVTRHLESADHALRSLVTALVSARLVTAVPLPAQLLPHLSNWNSPTDLPAAACTANPPEI